MRGQLKMNIAADKASLHIFGLRNDLYCVEWGVKLYSLPLPHYSPYIFLSPLPKFLLGERCKLPQRGLEIEFGAFSPQNMTFA